MAHVRQQIRDAVVALLKNNIAGVGSNVFPTRTRPVGHGKLPAILIFTTNERSETSAVDPDEDCGKLYRRTVTIAVDILVQEDAADDRLDDLAALVEARIESEASIGGLVRVLALTTTGDVFDGQGERVSGRKRLLYEATYLTKATAPDVALF